MSSDYKIVGQALMDSILAGDEHVTNRATLGNTVPIKLFQSLRIMALGVSMEDMVGPGARALVYQAGQRLGEQFGKPLSKKADGQIQAYLDLVEAFCVSLSIGRLVVEHLDLSGGRITVRLDECVSSAGLKGAQAPICHFETGMVAGFFRAFSGANVKAIETRCYAVGDETCGIDVTIY